MRRLTQDSSALLDETWHSIIPEGSFEGILREEAEQAESEGFDPTSTEDARRRIMASIVRRQGSGKFRTTLLRIYEGRCAISGCDVEAILEASHIKSYAGPDTNHLSNGLLLRADIHTLFDLDLISIDPEKLTGKTSPSLKGTEYERLGGRKLRLPKDPRERPSLAALALRFAQARW